MRGQRGIERVRREEEWQSVFVPGPNEPSNAMNRLFTMVWLVQSELVMCHWQDITQLCLPGLRCSCQYARFASRPPYHTCFHCINTITSSLYLSFLFFSQGQHTLICFSFLLQEHIFKLMKSDSYARFLRSNIYQDLLLARKKVSCTHWPPCHLLCCFLVASLILIIFLWFKRHSRFISIVCM